jgi:hypothetical protein
LQLLVLKDQVKNIPVFVYLIIQGLKNREQFILVYLPIGAHFPFLNRFAATSYSPFEA